MTSWVSYFQRALLLAFCASLSGCLPSGRGLLDEEKEAYFVQGKSRVNSLDYKGAIESFEKALEANPGSALAHFELACLFEKRQTDPAAAIYHYSQYLRLRPKPENTEIVNEHVMACKQELARTVSLGPVSERQQRELEQLAEENKRLRQDLEKWRAYANHLQTLTNGACAPVLVRPEPSTSSTAPRPQPAPRSEAVVSGAVSSGRSTTANSRAHTIQAGETPTTIAKRYGVRVQALMAANPRLDARRLHPGQTLTLPSP
jgi:tetratricopeptide (TPR) repeat protein